MTDKTAQVLIIVPDDPPQLAGIPAVLRTAHELASGPRGLGIILQSSSADFQSRWRRVLARVSGLQQGIDAGRPLLALSPDGCPDPEALKDFLGRVNGLPTACMWKGQVVAVYYPRASDLPPSPLLRPPPALETMPPDAWAPLHTAQDRRQAERRLFKGLSSESDGYIARYDRRLSLALSSLLIRTPVTPNQITATSLALGILGAWALTSTGYAVQAAGAFVLWFCCLLDGCDGEVARLKFQTSETGALYDSVADHLAHLFTFAGIALHIRNNYPDAAWAVPGALMLAGVVLSMLAVWRLILSRPQAPAELERVFERVASRDYIYLVLALVLAGRLQWFLWGAAFGSHAFWLALVLTSRRGRDA